MTNVTIYAIPFFLTTMALEHWSLRRKGKGYELADTAASLSGGLGSLFAKAALVTLHYAAFSWVYQHRLFTLTAGVGTFALLFLAEDFCYYWYHRVSHEVRFFWAAHVVHHSSQRYTLGTALRQSWTAPLVGVVFWLPLPLLGFRPEWVTVMQGLSLLYQYWIHTESIRTLGPLEWVLNTPSHHRVHHGSNARYLDRNHAGILIVWDRLFGTFQKEEEDPIYGLTKNVGSFNPVWIQVHEYAAIASDVLRARGLREKLRAVFASPESLAQRPLELAPEHSPAEPQHQAA